MVTFIVTLTGRAPPWAWTPSRPSAPRVSGMIASGPASPISPIPPRIGKVVALDTTPPRANGITLPCENAAPSRNGSKPPISELKPSARKPPSAFCTGFIAWLNGGLTLATLKESILATAQATATWLADQQPGFRYFAIGAGDLHAALSAVGREDAAHADFVVVGEGPGLDYESLSIAINLVLKQGARLVSTNPDANVDAMVDGVHRVLPGGGALVAAVAVATGVQPTVIGKPNPLLFRLALASLGLQPGQCIMVGDRPDTDIAGALALGMRTALVRTGRFGVADALPESVHPDWDVADLAALIAAWKVSTDRPS